RLAGAVRPHEPDVLAALERERGAVQQLVVPRCDPQPLRLGDRPSASGRVEEVEAQAALPRLERLQDALRVAALTFEAADLGQLRLRLLCLVLLVPEAFDEPLEPVDVDRESIGRLAGRRGARASEERVSSPPEKLSSGRSRSSSVKPRPRTTDAVRSRQSYPPACSSRPCASA